MKQENFKKFIFFERSGRRWKYSKITFFILSLILLIFLIFIVKGLVDRPVLNAIEISNSMVEPINQPVPSDGKEFSLVSLSANEEISSETFVFYQSKDHPNGENKSSLTQNIDLIDVLIPDWFYLNESAMIVAKNDSKIDKLARENGVRIIPQISLDGDSNADTVHEWLSNQATKEKIIGDLLSIIKEKDYDGIHVNFEDVYYEDKELFNEFVADLYNSFHSNGLLVTLFVRMGDATYDSNLLAQVSDHIIIKAFDQHIEQGEAGSLASFNWTHDWIAQYKGPKEKLVITLANYGYDWNKTSGDPATPLHFPTIMELVTRENLQIQWDEKNLSPYVRYKEQNKEHIIHFLDVATFYNQMKIASSHGIPSIGIWNIGSEDPSIWKLFSNDSVNLSGLETIQNTVSVKENGSGDFIKVTKVEADGKRKFEVKDNIIVKEVYESYPTPYQLDQFGLDEKKVAISFDDGPSPKYTEKVLDILQEYDVKAVFFPIGSNAAMHPRLVKKIYEEGHEIGSHTFTHADVLKISENQLEFELNTTQRVLQGITGHSTILFRPPFLSINGEKRDQPSKEVLDKIFEMQNMGYTIVGSSIDPQDWDGKSADEIFIEVTKNVHNGQIILLHDAGGDRTPTIEALPKIIEWLKDKGYSIVPSSELVGKSRSEVMPSVQAVEESIVPVYFFGSSISSSLITGMKILLYTLIMIGLLRLVVLVYYSLKQKRKSKRREYDDSYQPFVSIVIAAFNEEKVIRQTIHSILNNKYLHFELIVVDDGSTDQTSNIIQQTFYNHPNIRLIRKENGGKASALNIGIQYALADIIVTLDADTLIAKNTISNMIRHFIDLNVAAVAGNVKIGNRKNLLTWWQHIEYVTGFNLEKRAFDELDCITVVPGAIGAWRKAALEEVGLFEEDTLAEDADVTLKLLRKGYKVRSEVEGIAYTEAPEDVKSFMKQRYRWTYGILQCCWKHKRAMFNIKNNNLGFIAMPNMIFQYLLLGSAPLADLFLVMGLVSKNLSIVYFYLTFLLLDALISVYSFHLEKEKKKPLLTLFIQRLVYRQFFTFNVWKSILFAIKGGLMGWNKLQRTGSVQQVVNKEKAKANAGV